MSLRRPMCRWGSSIQGAQPTFFACPALPGTVCTELISVWQLSKLASGCQGTSGGGAEQDEAIQHQGLASASWEGEGKNPVKARKRLHLGMGGSGRFWSPQTRLLEHSPGCGCLHSPNSLVYTTWLDANRPAVAVEAVRCAAGEDWGIGSARVVLTRIHMTAYTPAAPGENENTQSLGPLSRPLPERDNRRSGVDFDSCQPFLHNPPLSFFPAPSPTTSFILPGCHYAPVQSLLALNTSCPFMLAALAQAASSAHNALCPFSESLSLFYPKVYYMYNWWGIRWL